MRRTVLTTSILSAMLLIAAPMGAAAQDADRPVVEAARQVTTQPNPVRLYVTPSVAVHPDDPDTVVVSASDARGGQCGLQVSRDGGLSWIATAVQVMPDDLPYCVQRNFGPVMPLEFASDGTLYMGLSGSSTETDPPHPNGPIDALIGRTSNLGRTHETHTVAEAGDYTYDPPEGESLTGFGQHRIPGLAVDPNDPDTVYRGWREWKGGLPDDVSFSVHPQRSYVAASTDGGETWSEPKDIFDGIEYDYFEETQELHTDFPSMVVADDGTVYAFSKERPPRAPEGQEDQALDARLLMATSTDGGETWTPSVINEGAQSLDTPVAAIDRDSGAIHLTWAQRGDSGDNPSEVYVMSSEDGGETWTDPVNVTDDDPAKGFNQYFPGISIAPNGRIDVAWHDFRNDPFFTPGGEGAGMGSEVSERYADVYYTYSTDGGSTWSDNIRVTDRSIDREIGASFSNMAIRGPIGLASTDDEAFLAWPDSRAGTQIQDAEDAYFTRVRFDIGDEQASASGVTPLGLGLGGGAALVLAGGVLLLAVRTRRDEGREGAQ